MPKSNTDPALHWVPTDSRPHSQGLAWWSLYFCAKLVLYWQGSLGLHIGLNLAFALLLLIPVYGPRKMRLRTLVASLLALVLLYYDSWLPSLLPMLSQLASLRDFSFAYWLELLGRLLSARSLLAGALLVLGYVLLNRYLRVSSLVIIALLVTAGQQWLQSESKPLIVAAAPQPERVPAIQQTPDAELQAFYRSESQRKVQFLPPAADSAFDVLLIHVCSLAWDDLREVGLDNSPLLSRFDFVFTHFNTATPYSGPAALRVLRASCGQTSHKGLYEPGNSQCFLFENLARLGFKNELLLNHDGHFDDFLSLLRKEGRLSLPLLSQQGQTVAQRGFDDSPIYDDYGMLKHWLEQRQQDQSSHIAAYYNTISLHDGNRLLDQPNLNSLDSYKARAHKLFSDLGLFIDDLERSQRKVILLLVPEHGAALHGDKQQFAGLRDIPTPAITIVPAAIKVIGGQGKPLPVRLDQPVSYLAISDILAQMLNRSPFGADYQPTSYSQKLPNTPFVAEDADNIVMQRGKQYLWRQSGGEWAGYEGLQ
ncbi:cellulose biosynthesis protein BcsG [Neisseriaceae bacterium TC5R-5]|nr:cellulose biosynthesis protein BcsG [Neisseriaceae bacterium TC5R-5]